MANVLTTGAWLSAPTKKPSFFVRLLRVQIDDHPTNEPAKIPHPATASPDSPLPASRIRFTTGTGGSWAQTGDPPPSHRTGLRDPRQERNFSMQRQKVKSALFVP